MKAWTIAQVNRYSANDPERFGDYVDAVLADIEISDAEVRAWVDLDPQRAKREARVIAESHPSSRPLWGVPVAIKDVIDVAGLRTSAGSPAQSEDEPAREDADVVARLRHSGALITGKTSSTEYAWFNPTETRNPREPSRSPGGSSSGSAAAVASGMCPVALGTQTAGSLMRPAAFCGVVAVKPTHGRVSTRGVLPVSPSVDVVGAFANRVADALLAIETIAYGRPRAVRPPLPEHPGPRIGVIRDYFWSEAAGDVLAGAEAALDRLSAAGARVSDVRLPASFELAHGQHETVVLAEMAYHRRGRFDAAPESLSEVLRRDIERGVRIDGDTYAAARMDQMQLRSEMNELAAGFDVLVTPGSKTLAPPYGSTGDPAFHIPFSFSGLPSLLLPTGWTDDGLPLSLQLVGAWGADESLGVTAQWCEAVLEFDFEGPNGAGGLRDRSE